MATGGATPLIALDATAVDTETTGLDSARARIVALGAVGISRGKVADERTLDLLVNPGEPIPGAAARIHGITDDRVRDANGFPAAFGRLLEFAGSSVLVGYSIGYDLAVFDRECRRAGLPFDKPRSLCVRLLTRLVDPDLPDHSLETIAAWLGVDIVGRHSALGDARAAAQIFVRLLPALRGQGIRTLGEAETACLDLSDELARGHQAGWVEPVTRPAPPAFSAIDPYAYRHRIADLMSHPVVTMKPATTLEEGIGRMVDRKISAILVAESGETGGPVADYGIVTERDVVRRIAAEGRQALTVPIGTIAGRPLASIRANAFVYRAVGRMDRLKIRHLAVRDDSGRLVGIVTARDLLALRAGSAIALDDTIATAGDPAAMAAAWATLPDVAQSLLAEDIEARTVADIVSEELCGLTKRACELAEEAMAEEGRGPPPGPYAVLVLGSAGRGESLLAPDQDNAIVFEQGAEGGREDIWFGELGARLASILDIAGVPFCKGGVMAMNPQFRGGRARWRERVDTWISRSRPEDLLNVDIFFDLKPVHGDHALGTELLDYAFERGTAEPAFAKLLGDQVQPESPFNLFGGLRLDEGRLDLKMHALFPIVSTARLLAIRHGIRARSTHDRLEGLIRLGIGGDSDLRAMIEGHALVIAVLLVQQSRDLHSGVRVSNRVEIARLRPEQRSQLKDIVQRMQGVPELIRSLMFA
ncbi:MAG: polymerase subunit epsilon [Rhizobiaceae bacterium]|nr:polymerase subunit epsilon [Rhizobiaceae bacterium]